jgi:hypothetical protein
VRSKTNGTWSSKPAPVPDGSTGHRFTVGADGSLVGLGFVQERTQWSLHASVDSTDTALTPARPPRVGYFPIPPAWPSLANGQPAFAVVTTADDGLRAVWPGNGALSETLIPSSARLVRDCPGSFVTPLDPCPGPCHEGAQGLELDAYAGARTQDGTTFVAYAFTHYDRKVHFDRKCDEPGCMCSPTVDEEHSTYDLRVVRMSADGTAPVSVLALPIDPPLSDRDEPLERLIDMRAYAMDVAVAIRLRHTDGSSKIRVVRIDGAIR